MQNPVFVSLVVGCLFVNGIFVFRAMCKRSVIEKVISFADLKINDVFCFYYVYDEDDLEGQGNTLSRMEEGCIPKLLEKIGDDEAKVVGRGSHEGEIEKVSPETKVLRYDI